METPIQTTESAIENEKLWACIKTGVCVCFLTAMICISVTYILVDQKFMNKPIYIIERNVLNNSGGQRIYVTEDMDHWWVTDDSGKKVTPAKEK